MIDIILVGAYGRMGKAIQEVIDTKAYEATISACVVEEKKEEDTLAVYTTIEEAVSKQKGNAPVIIDFSIASNTLHIVSVAKQYNIPIVIGTTGFNKTEYETIIACADVIPILLSSNMSKGITALMRILPQLVGYLGKEYDVELIELHHKRKKDAPSGTALTLAKCLAEGKGWDIEEVSCYHREGMIGERKEKELGIQTLRGGGANGMHSIFLIGEEEHIEITHTAYSRKAFARGAIQAAIWLQRQKKGLYSMMDVE